MRATGWECTGADANGRLLWLDKYHLGKKDELHSSAKIPLPGGGLEVVEQWYLPPVPWPYGTEAAVAIQKGRDMEAAGMTLEQKIAHKEQELEALKRQRTPSK